MALIAMALHIHDMVTDSQNLQNLLPILFECIPKGRLNRIGLWEPPARHKARIGGGRLSALRKPLKVVGIVDRSARNGLARDPGEGLVAARAEHLVTVMLASEVF